jgi:hypothetical protein
LAANACAIAPDTHEDQAWSGLAAFPRPGGSAAPEERWFRAESKRFSVSMAVGFSTPISGWVTARAIRFLLPLATTVRRPIQLRWLQPSHRTWLAGPPSFLQAKQRVTSNGWPSLRMW